MESSGNPGKVLAISGKKEKSRRREWKSRRRGFYHEGKVVDQEGKARTKKKTNPLNLYGSEVNFQAAMCA